MKKIKNSYDELSDLMLDLQNDIEESLSSEVLEEVRDIVVEHVYDDVLNVYNPKIYKRRANGGISDRKNIIGNVANMELSVIDITEFNDSYGTANHGVGLAELINDGNGRFYYDFDGSFTKPRRFWDNSAYEIETTNRVEKTLEKCLKQKGWS